MIGWLILAGVVWIVLYAGVCAVWPWGRCGRCDGSGRKYQPLSRKKNWRDCRKCGGTGRRVRLGRRFWSWVGKRKHDAVG
jgi:hypothetical protein